MSEPAPGTGTAGSARPPQRAADGNVPTGAAQVPVLSCRGLSKIYTGGPQDVALRQQVMALDLKDRVVFTGRVPHDDVNRYYDLVDVLVYPRHPMRLTDLVTPLKPLEAMAQGRLMVASDVGGHKELIQDGKTGVLFRAGNAGDLASKVVALLKYEQGWDALKRNGRQFVEAERNWAASVARYRGVYGSLVQPIREAVVG